MRHTQCSVINLSEGEKKLRKEEEKEKKNEMRDKVVAAELGASASVSSHYAERRKAPNEPFLCFCPQWSMLFDAAA